MPPLLVVAEVRRTHGLAGEVLAEVLTDFPERLHEGVSVLWRSGGSERTLTVRRARPHGRRLRLAFDGVETVDAARALQGGDLCVAVEDAHPAPEGFYYSHEVAGFQCQDPSGRSLGTATGLAKTPGGPMLTVEREGREALVPWTRPIVVEVDRNARRIVIDAPEGLFDL
jgi:16S rRNA processing protein RimM